MSVIQQLNITFSLFDADAQAFITAAGITDSIQKNAINSFVLELKSFSVWTKIKVIYPFVGGNATSHSFNLKNTAAFQIVWSGGVTHNSSGITGNALNAYGDTGYIASSQGIGGGVEYASLYCSTNPTPELAIEFGSVGSTFIHTLAVRYQNLFYGNIGSGATSTANTDSRGFFQAFRYDTSNVYLQKNTTRNNIVVANIGYSTLSDSILAYNNGGTIALFSSKTLSMSMVGLNASLTTTDMDNIYTAVQNYQTALSRNV